MTKKYDKLWNYLTAETEPDLEGNLKRHFCKNYCVTRVFFNGREMIRAPPEPLFGYECHNCRRQFVRKRYLWAENRYICCACMVLYDKQNIFDRSTEGERMRESERGKMIRLQFLKIYHLRKHQKSIKAVVTMLSYKILRSHDLTRMLKSFLY